MMATNRRLPDTADIHALVTEEWKLIYYAGDPNGELYNLKDDPQELNNLYNRAQAADIQRNLTARLLDRLIRESGYCCWKYRATQVREKTAHTILGQYG